MIWVSMEHAPIVIVISYIAGILKVSIGGKVYEYYATDLDRSYIETLIRKGARASAIQHLRSLDMVRFP